MSDQPYRITVEEYEFLRGLRQQWSHSQRLTANQETLRIAREGRGYAVTAKHLVTGADPDARDENGNTGLILASANGHWSTARAFLHARAATAIRNNENKPAFLLAVDGGHTKTIEVLREYQPDSLLSMIAAAHEVATRNRKAHRQTYRLIASIARELNFQPSMR